MDSHSADIIIEENSNDQGIDSSKTDGQVRCTCGEYVVPKTVTGVRKGIRYCLIACGLLVLSPLMLLCIPLALGGGGNCDGCKCKDLNCGNCRCNCTGEWKCLDSSKCLDECKCSPYEFCFCRCFDQCCKGCSGNFECCAEGHIVDWNFCCYTLYLCPVCGEKLNIE